MRLDHVTIRTTDLPATVRFFTTALGLSEGDHPEVGIPVAWLYSEGWPLLHVFAAHTAGSDSALPANTPPNTPLDASANAPANAIDHLALQVDDMDAILARLDRGGIPYKEISLSDASRRQIFLTAPGGVTIELVQHL